MRQISKQDYLKQLRTKEKSSNHFRKYKESYEKSILAGNTIRFFLMAIYCQVSLGTV